MTRSYKEKNQKTFLETLFLGLFKAVWWLVKLPFSKKRRNTTLTQSEKNQIIKKIITIEDLLDSKNKIELTHALFEADKLVDYVLKTCRYCGETFADRLRSSEPDIDPDIYNMVWQGHKVRNQLAHETDSQVSDGEIKSATVKLLRFLKNV